MVRPRMRLLRLRSWPVVGSTARWWGELGHTIILLMPITSNPVVRIRLHPSFFRRRTTRGYSYLQFFIDGPIVEVAVLVFIEHIDDMRVGCPDNMVVNDYFVLINGNRLACLIIAGLKDI